MFAISGLANMTQRLFRDQLSEAIEGVDHVLDRLEKGPTLAGLRIKAEKLRSDIEAYAAQKAERPGIEPIDYGNV